MMGRQFLDMNSNAAERTMSDEERAHGCGSDNPNANSNDGQQPKRKCHRHTLSQIQELETFFKECPHPNARQKKELGRQLGMEVQQIKFWFQNKRTQIKSQQERRGNTELRRENEELRLENMKYREALSNRYCPACGSTAMGDIPSDECRLRMENDRLREEIECIAVMAAEYVGKPLSLRNPGEASSSAAPLPQQPPSSTPTTKSRDAALKQEML